MFFCLVKICYKNVECFSLIKLTKFYESTQFGLWSRGRWWGWMVMSGEGKVIIVIRTIWGDHHFISGAAFHLMKLKINW